MHLKLVALQRQGVTRGAGMDLDANQREILKLLGSRRKAQNLFSVEELARFLEVSVRSIRRLHAVGAAPPRIRRSRRLMYPMNGVLAWLPGYLSDDAQPDNK
jgi:hypothetical protein